MFTVYIIYSDTLKKYYTGFTSQSIDERLGYHLGKHSGFTSKAKDWLVIYKTQKEEKSQALQLEKKIKKRGAKRFLDDCNS